MTRNQYLGIAAVFVVLTGFILWTIDVLREQHNKDMTRASVAQWVDFLDAQTTVAGTYVRQDLDADDAWGNPLVVLYAQGGLVETVTVRSFGPDGISHTVDDIAAMRKAANAKGLGSGLRDGIGDTVKNAATGFREGIRP